MEKEGMERTEKEKWFNYARGLGLVRWVRVERLTEMFKLA